jgi:hypothetical protein
MNDAIPTAIRHASLLAYADECMAEAMRSTDMRRVAELAQEALMARLRALTLEEDA